MRFGVWHAVDAESLSDAFESVAAGTEAADAAIELVTVPAQITCRGCGSSADSTDLLAVCPRCASTDVELTGGDEMTLESVGVHAGRRRRRNLRGRICAWESRLGWSR